MSGLPRLGCVAPQGVFSGKVSLMDVRRWVAAALCVPLFALAGCSDEKSQAQPKEPSTGAQPSESSSETGPSIPPEAMGSDEASAKAFLRYFVETINHAEQSGDFTPLRAASDSRCKSCSGIIKTVEDLYAEGGHLESNGWTVSGLTAYPDNSAESPVIAARVRISSQRAYSADGSIRHFEGGMQSADFQLNWRDGRWTVRKFELVAS